MDKARLDPDEIGDRLHYVISSRAAATVHPASSFQLRAREDCTGQVLVDDVVVVALTNYTDPVAGSYGVLYLPHGVFEGTAYVCTKFPGTMPLFSDCLASLDHPDTTFRLSHLLDNSLVKWFVPDISNSIRILDNVGTVNLLVMEWVLAIALVFGVFATGLVVVSAGVLPGLPAPRKFRAMHIASAPETFVRNVIQMITFTAGMVNLAALSVRAMTLSAESWLVHAILTIGCVLAVAGILRLCFHMCIDQLYEAGLANGKVFIFPRTWYHIDLVLVLMMASMMGLILYGLVTSSTGQTNTLADCASAILGLLKVVHSTYFKQRDQHRGICRMSLSDLDAAVKGRDVKDDGKADILKHLTEDDRVTMKWEVFCQLVREGQDPLRDERPPEELPEGSTFGIWDLSWQPKLVHAMRGTKIAFVNVPLACAFVIATVGYFGCETFRFEALMPTLARLQPSVGVVVPTFDPLKKEYTLFHHEAYQLLSLMSEHNSATTRHTDIWLTDKLLANYSELHSDVTSISLSLDRRYPLHLEVRQEGLGGKTHDYDIVLAPVRSIVVSMFLRTEDGWSRCLHWREATSVDIALPLDAKGVDVELFVIDYAIMVPATRADLENARAMGITAVISIFETYPEATEAACWEICKNDELKECVFAVAGVGGCYFAYLPTSKVSCERSHSRGLPPQLTKDPRYQRFKQESEDVMRFCAPGELRKAECLVAASPKPGYFRFEQLPLPWKDRRLARRLEHSMVTSVGQELLFRMEDLRFHQGVPLPRSVLVLAPHGVKTAATHISSSEISFDFLEYNMSQVPLTFRIYVIPELLDDDFELEFEKGQEIVTEFADRDLGLYDLSACKTATQDFSYLEFCGGTVRRKAVLLEVSKFEPRNTRTVVVVKPRTTEDYLRNMDAEFVRITFFPMQQSPAIWSIRQACTLDFTGMPVGLLFHLFKADVFEAGLSLCPTITLIYETESMCKHLALTPALFLEMGFLMLRHRHGRAYVGLLESASKNPAANSIFDDMEVTSSGIKYSFFRVPDEVRAIAPETLVIADGSGNVELSWAALLEYSSAGNSNFTAKLCQLGQGKLSHRVIASAMRLANQQRILDLLECLVLAKSATTHHFEASSAAVAAIRWHRVELLDRFIEMEGIKSWIIDSIYWEGGLVAGHPSRVGERSLLDFAVKYSCWQCLPVLKQAINKLAPVVEKMSKSATVAGIKTLAKPKNLLMKFKTAILRGVVNYFSDRLSIKTLRLSAMRLYLDDIPRIAALIYNLRGDITAVDVSANDLGHEGLKQLGTTFKAMPSLSHLDLGRNVAGGCRRSAETGLEVYGFLAQLPSLRRLVLSNLGLCDAGLEAVSAVLSKLPLLEELDLSSNDISLEGAKALAPSLKLMHGLRRLDLSFNPLGMDGLLALDLKNLTHNLVELRIGGIGLQRGDDYRTLDQHLEGVQGLEVFDLSNNPLCDDGVAALEPAFAKWKGLKTLNIQNTSLRAASIHVFQRVFGSCSSLQQLNISRNALGPEELDALNQTSDGITILDLRGTELGDEGAVRLASILKKFPRLKELHIDSNGIGGAGFAALGPVLKGAANLEELTLGDNLRDCEQSGQLGEAINGLTYLLRLDVSGSCLSKAFFDAVTRLPRLQVLRMHHLEVTESRMPTHQFRAGFFSDLEALKQIDVHDSGMSLWMMMHILTELSRIPGLTTAVIYGNDLKLNTILAIVKKYRFAALELFITRLSPMELVTLGPFLPGTKVV